MTKGCIYTTENRLDPKIAEACRTQLKAAFQGEIIWVSLESLTERPNIILNATKGYFTMFKEILAGLEASKADIVYLTEHDVLYPKEHFDFTPPDKNMIYYDLNWWKVRKDGLAVHWDAVQVSGICAHRELLIEHYKERIAKFDYKTFDRKFEPTVETKFETWRADVPHIDIRHETNTTYNKWHIQHFRNKATAINFTEATIHDIPGWNTEVIKSIIE